jgi:ABC-type polysaccharide/polyol phosphate transport system ATPase subunit
MNAVTLQGVSKCYSIYERPIDRLKEILVQNRKSFHREYWALKDINLTFEKGTTTALLGPNGSGKSTMLQIVANVLQPSTGTVHIDGRLTAILELGAGFQPEYTGRENIILNGMILGIPQEEMLERLDEIAEFAEIGDFFDQPIKTYSSGMIVRLAFGCAISVDPEILLVDEALAVGDQAFQKKCVTKIQALQAAGKTILFVSHDVKAVRKFCDRGVVLNGGQIIADGPTSEVMEVYEELMANTDLVASKVISHAQPMAR